MSIESENTSTSAAEAPGTKGPRKAKKAKPGKKAGRAKKPAGIYLPGYGSRVGRGPSGWISQTLRPR